MTKKYLHNPHAGDILKEEFLIPLNMSQDLLAKNIDVAPNRIHAIVSGSRAITAEIDLLLCKFFGLSEGYWLRLQNTYEIMEAKRSLGDKLKTIKTFKNPKVA
jgi:addiction module HigA family antidote